MPIKFRCEHCKQLIGIAEIKAGSLVDCPTCGRTLRVPNRDGSLAPLPQPQVNHADDGLRKALNELAQMSATGDVTQSGVTELTPAPEDMNAADKGRSADAPVDRQANSVALEPLPPMQVVDPSQPRRPIPIKASTAGSKGTESPESILAAIPASPAERRAERRDVALNPPSSGISVTTLSVACVCSLLVGLAIGYFVGHGNSAKTDTKPLVTASDVPQKPAPAASQPHITGRITYQDERQKPQPDAGACVLLLPTKPNAEHKLSIIGLRPSDDDVARQAAISRLEEQGGKLAQTDDQGQYQLEVPGKGEYQLVALSHFHGRAGDDAGDAATLKAIGKYFDRPNQLVGKLAFRLKTITYSGSGETTWNCTFGDDK